ncbi:hypothetical protein [Arenibaculum pallidiluteum]|uniref:hypothetical protein n=1 Tax=Arenibaculum pallidiluteum TaxID=2812559 RepID=UPI001A972F17|nr:hypothetical protein [Arenibaculum pallidiluteum]
MSSAGEEPGRDIQGVLMMLRDSRRLIEAGVLVDLVGLDIQVEAACRTIASMDPTAAQTLLGDLAAVAAELAAIEAECARRREALAPVPVGPAQADRNRAVTAYSRNRDEGP